MGMCATDQIVMNRTILAMERLNFPSNEIESFSSLEHHGIKGMKWGVRRTPEQLGHKVASSKKKFRVRSAYERETERLRKLEKKMKQKEEITRRKNELAEREARLKDLGKSEKTLQNERDAAEKKRQQAEAKAAKKQADVEKKAAKREAAQEEKRIRQEIKAAKKKADREAEKEKKIAEHEAELARKKAKRDADREREEQKERNARKISDMTDSELQAVIDRLDLEKKYKAAIASAGGKKSFSEKASGVVSDVGKTLYKSSLDALKESSKTVFKYFLDESIEKLSGGKIKRDTKKGKNNSGGSGGGSA